MKPKKCLVDLLSVRLSLHLHCVEEACLSCLWVTDHKTYLAADHKQQMSGHNETHHRGVTIQTVSLCFSSCSSSPHISTIPSPPAHARSSLTSSLASRRSKPARTVGASWTRLCSSLTTDSSLTRATFSFRCRRRTTEPFSRTLKSAAPRCHHRRSHLI